MNALLALPVRDFGQNGGQHKGGSMEALTVDLGINDAAIKYEVALEILGQERQPFMGAIRAERAKPAPSASMIRYCEMRLAALDELQGSLRAEDAETVTQILDKKNRLFRS
jgi:hypothetical protein